MADLVDVPVRLAFGGAVPGCTSYDDALAAASTEPLADQPHGDDFLYSSGTTGRPKGIKLPLLDDQGRRAGLPLRDDLRRPVRLRRGHRLPLAGAGLPRGAAALHGRDPGARRHGRADAALRSRGLPATRSSSYRVTDTQVVPTMFVRLLKLPEEVRASYDTSSLKTVVHAAAPCPVEVKQQMMDWLGPIVHEYYASTEANGATYVGPDDWLGAPGHGRPVAARHARGSATRRARSCRPARSGRSTSSATTSRSPTTATPTGRRPRSTPSTRSGRRSATSATSTTRATSTSPTARRS